jgi:hypothetical protein
LWEMRIPRPFVSEVYLLWTLVAALALLAAREHGRIYWIVLGAAFALLLQGDVHAALLFAVASPALIYYAVKRDGVAQTVRGCIYGGLALAVVAAPFVVQQLLELPEIRVRWGMFPMDRRVVFTFFEPGFPGALVRSTLWPMWLLGQAALLTVLFVALRHRIKQHQDSDSEAVRRVRMVLPYVSALLVAAVVYFPVSILVLGSTIQPSHFYDRTIRVFSYLVIVLVVVCVGGVADRLARRRAYVYVTLAAVLVIGLGYRMREASVFRGHLRPQFFGYASEARPSYRESFAELTSFLDRNVPRDAVVASFDHQVYSWWLTFHPGYSFLADPFVSSAPDREVEIRLALLCRVLGLSAQEYARLIQEPVINWFWLGSQKYQASLWHTYALLDDYTAEQRQQILQTAAWWHDPIVPQSELKRLTTQYENVTETESGKRSMDVIVLGNRGLEQPWAPQSDEWRLRFSNDGFRVYVSRDGATDASTRGLRDEYSDSRSGVSRTGLTALAGAAR